MKIFRQKSFGACASHAGATAPVPHIAPSLIPNVVHCLQYHSITQICHCDPAVRRLPAGTGFDVWKWGVSWVDCQTALKEPQERKRSPLRRGVQGPASGSLAGSRGIAPVGVQGEKSPEALGYLQIVGIKMMHFIFNFK